MMRQENEANFALLAPQGKQSQVCRKKPSFLDNYHTHTDFTVFVHKSPPDFKTSIDHMHVLLSFMLLHRYTNTISALSIHEKTFFNKTCD